jgi:G3E family GTPase
VGDFGRALTKVLEEYHPDRILIEPSGVGKLSDVIQAVKDVNSDQLHLNALVTVADAGKCRLYMKNFGEFFNNQIEHAGTIMLSRTSEMPEKKLLECVDLIRQHNPKATVITTPWAELAGAQMLDAMEQRDSLAVELEQLASDGEEVCSVCGHTHHHDHDHHHEDDHGRHEHHHEHEHACDCGHHHEHEHTHHEHDCDCAHHEHEHTHHHHHEHGCTCGCGHDHHHADEVFSSWGMESPKHFSKETLDSALDSLAENKAFGMVLRAKGIVPCSDGSWIHFDYVPGEKNLRTGSPAVIGRLCVIGAELQEEALETLFQNA